MAKLFGKIYRVVENPFEKDAGIELIDSEWKGLVYQYGDVQFVEGQPEINFQRTIVMKTLSHHFGIISILKLLIINS